MHNDPKISQDIPSFSAKLTGSAGFHQHTSPWPCSTSGVQFLSYDSYNLHQRKHIKSKDPNVEIWIWVKIGYVLNVGWYKK